MDNLVITADWCGVASKWLTVKYMSEFTAVSEVWSKSSLELFGMSQQKQVRDQCDSA